MIPSLAFLFFTKNETYYRKYYHWDYFLLQGTEIVEALFFDASEFTNINLSPKAFEHMVNLRLLVFRDHKEIKFVSLPYGLDLLPENLRFFLWDGYPWKSLPPTFCPEMLVELSLWNSNVEKLWNGEMVCMFHVFIIILLFL
jgi:hypothetical protein